MHCLPFALGATRLSALRATAHSGQPAGRGARAGGLSARLRTALTACAFAAVGLCVTLLPGLPAPEVLPDTPTPRVVHGDPDLPPQPAAANHPSADEDPPPPTPPLSPAEELKRRAQEFLAFEHRRRWLGLSHHAAADFTFLPPELSARSTLWDGLNLPQPHGTHFRSSLTQGRLSFRVEADDPMLEGSEEGLTFFTVAASDLRTAWRDAGGTRYDFGWQTLSAGFARGHAGIHSMLFATTGIAWPVAVGAAWDHLALHAAGAASRYRDGVRLNLDLWHLDGGLWTDGGVSIGFKFDTQLGVGVMAGHLYGVTGFEFEPRLGLAFLRGAADHCDIPYGSLYLGIKTGGRWLWAAGPDPVQLQNAMWIAPTLSLQLYF